MYDSWYVTGLAVIRPGLLKAISDAKPVFNFVDRIIVEVQNGKRTLRPKAPWTGVLEKTSTQNVRDAISAFAKKFSASAPPIGIYVAGRFEQYLAIPMFSSALPDKSKFSDIVDLANSAYVAALAGGPESTLPTFPAFLGLCMMDGAVANNLEQASDQQIAIASEFGIKADAANRDWQIATNFVKQDNFASAAQLLMRADLDPWQGGSLEQIIFWEGFNEWAIS